MSSSEMVSGSYESSRRTNITQTRHELTLHVHGLSSFLLRDKSFLCIKDNSHGFLYILMD